MNAQVNVFAPSHSLFPLLPMVGSTSTFYSKYNMFQPQVDYTISQTEQSHIATTSPDMSEGIFRVFSKPSTSHLSAYVYPSIESVDKIDVSNQYMEEIADKARKTQQNHQTYRLRIEDLRSDAEIDGFTVNERSEIDFWSFIISVPFASKAEVVLLDNSNLRVIWDDEDGNHFGIQFLGDRILQYVIFRRRKGTNHISRVAGQDTFDGVKQQLRTFDLESLLQV